MNVEVTSVSKKEQKLSKTGAAIFVITQEDIRRSGATNITDLLRMVPGVDVARIDHSTWAVSIRGFNGGYANKVRVLIDGRSVYHPAYSGARWYAQDVPLEDIERIEVIHGPGGTVWGANAMNGVINIITKSAKNTRGGLITAGAGSDEQGEGLVQYGGGIGTNGDYRIYGRYSNVGKSDPAGSAQPADSKRLQEGGFRSNWNLSPHDLLTVQGEVHLVDGGETLTGVVAQVPPVMGTYGWRMAFAAEAHTPSNTDSGLEAVSAVEALPQGAFGLVTILGNPNTKVEQLHDYEIGYRAQITRRLSSDITGFLSFYQNLQTSEPQTPYFTLTPGPPHLVIPFLFEYEAHALSYGAEAFANWNVTDRWNLLEPRHAEFPDFDFINHMLGQRSIFGKITSRF